MFVVLEGEVKDLWVMIGAQDKKMDELRKDNQSFRSGAENELENLKTKVCSLAEIKNLKTKVYSLTMIELTPCSIGLFNVYFRSSYGRFSVADSQLLTIRIDD